MRLPVLIAADGASWEAALVLALEGSEHAVAIVRRCVDVVELLAVAASGQARAALVSAELRRLDGDAIDRLAAAEVIAVGVIGRDDAAAEQRLRALGIEYIVAADADPSVIVAVLEDAAAAAHHEGAGTRSVRTATSLRGFADVAAATRPVEVASDEPRAAPARRATIIAVWGPTGAPGRTTVAVSIADELSRLGGSSLLIDADVYGGVVGQVLGLLDESAGLAAVCRQAAAGRLDASTLAALCWQVRPSFRVLTGIPRAERWPELRPSALTSVLGTARALADFVVLDCGFCLESDEELSFDSLAPRRNGATLTILDAADLVLVVGAADPVGLQRLTRGLVELRDAGVATTSWVLLNKVRAGVAPGDPAVEVRDALARFTGRVPAALLPNDASALDSAQSIGRTLAEAAPNSPLRRALVELAAAVAGVPAPVPRRHRRRA